MLDQGMIRKKMNKCAKKAERALKQTYDPIYETEDYDQDSITDMLTDLMHLCQRDELQFEAFLSMARRHFECEQKGDFDPAELN